jgi:hypothetical protein
LQSKAAQLFYQLGFGNIRFRQKRGFFHVHHDRLLAIDGHGRTQLGHIGVGFHVESQRTEDFFFRAFGKQMTAAETNGGEARQQIDVETVSGNQHNVGTNSQHVGKCKDTYGQTIQQNRKTETSAELSQAQKCSGQNEEGRKSQNLSASFRTNEKTTCPGGLFCLEFKDVFSCRHAR